MTDQLLSDASLVAQAYRYDRVELEHLLYVLLRDGACRAAAERAGLDPDQISSVLSKGFEFRRSGRLIGAHRLTLSDEVSRVVALAEHEEGSLFDIVLGMTDSSRPVGPVTGLGAISDPLPELDDLLDHLEGEEAQFGFDRICRDVFHKEARITPPRASGLGPAPEGDRAEVSEKEPGPNRSGQADRTSLSGKERAEAQRAVERSIRDLTELHRSGQLDPVIGRDREIDQICEVLMRRRKSNVLLVGDPGVGKTALMEGVAARVADSPDPALSSRPVLQASLGALVSGARYRGDFEIRMELLVELALERHAILFFDEMQMLIGSGATAERGMDGANLLKPVLARDGLSLVGATTLEEAKALRSDPALMRRFEELLVEEPTPEQMREILRGASASYLAHHRVRADRHILERLIDFADRYMPHRLFPDKAFDLLDTACVRARISGRSSIRVEDIRDAVRRLGGTLPDLSLRHHEDREAEAARLLTRLRKNVAGQEEALLAIVQAYVGRDRNAPLRIRLDGPKGVGRRTLARSFSKAIGGGFREVNVADGAERIRSALLQMNTSKDQPLTLLVNAGDETEEEVRSVLDRLMSEGITDPHKLNGPEHRNMVVLVRSDNQKDRIGFTFSQKDISIVSSDERKVVLNIFCGDRLREAVSFEIERLSRLWSDSGVSRAVPEVESVVYRLPAEVRSWSEIATICQSCLDEG
jgi:ATP-dependent Clp protease ATP-binding subunit ClpA